MTPEFGSDDETTEFGSDNEFEGEGMGGHLSEDCHLLTAKRSSALP